jgi:hypothetical protein
MTYMILGPLVGLVTGAAGVLFLKWRTRVELDAKKSWRMCAPRTAPSASSTSARSPPWRPRSRRWRPTSRPAARRPADNAHHVHERMDVLDDRLLVIETQLGVKKSA